MFHTIVEVGNWTTVEVYLKIGTYDINFSRAKFTPWPEQSLCQRGDHTLPVLVCLQSPALRTGAIVATASGNSVVFFYSLLVSTASQW
jgi:hypothetical protein